MSATRARPPRSSGLVGSLGHAGGWLGAAVVFGLCLLALVPGSGPQPVRLAVVELGSVVLALGVALACRRTALRAVGYHRRVWNLFATTGLLWALARGLTVYGQQLPRHPAHSALADICYLAAVATAATGLCLIPQEERAQPERLRVWLGTGIILSSVVLFCRSLILAVPAPAPASAQAILDRGYPALYIALACVVWVVLLRVGTQARRPLFLVTAALLGYAWANVYWAYHSEIGAGYSREVLDAGSVWCFLLFILAAVSPNATNPRQPAVPHAKARYVGFQSLVVYVPVVTSSVVVSALPRPHDPLVIGSGLLVLVLFGLRLTVLSVDNSRLRDDLESRVEALTSRTAELRRLVLQNERIVQSVVDGVIGVDALGFVTFVNPAACAMLGYSRDELLGLAEHEIFHGHRAEAAAQLALGRPPVRQLVDDEPLLNCCVVATSMNTGTPAASDRQGFVTADGSVFPVELAVGPILEEGQITGAVVVFRDVSERLKIEQMKNEFVSVVSHELRTPLTSIRGSLGLLAGGAAGPLSGPGERMVQVALDSSERLTRLINDMLDIERIESGTIPVVLTDCDAGHLINQAVDGLRVLAHRHRLHIGVDSGMPQVRADADRIVQALTNLIGNAVKFSPAGTTIGVRAVASGQFIEFAVSDQGRGIPADKIGRIFERFEQVDSSDSREMGGTGLGLAISRTIIRRHGGDIWATSQPGLGSTFRFTLPTVEPQALVLSDVGGAESVGRLVGGPSVLPDGKTSDLRN